MLTDNLHAVRYRHLRQPTRYFCVHIRLHYQRTLGLNEQPSESKALQSESSRHDGRLHRKCYFPSGCEQYLSDCQCDFESHWPFYLRHPDITNYRFHFRWVDLHLEHLWRVCLQPHYQSRIASCALRQFQSHDSHTDDPNEQSALCRILSVPDHWEAADAKDNVGFLYHHHWHLLEGHCDSEQHCRGDL